MRKRRLVSLLLAASLAASTLAGCGSGGKTETTAAAAGGQTEAAGSGTTGETGAAGPARLTLGHHWRMSG